MYNIIIQNAKNNLQISNIIIIVISVKTKSDMCDKSLDLLTCIWKDLI